MTIIKKETAPRFDHEGVTVTAYSSPTRGSAAVSAWRLVLAPGAGSPVHELSHGEAFVALQGAARVSLGAEQLVLRAGDGLSVPPDTAFAIRNEGEEPFEAIACMAAGGQAKIGDGESFTPPWAL